MLNVLHCVVMLSLFAQAETAQPKMSKSEALLAEAASLSKTGRLQEAEPLLRKAVALNPQLAAAHLEWANVLARLHRFPEAQAALRAVKPPAETEQRIAYDRLAAAIASGTGDARHAAEAMADAVALSPGDVRLAAAYAATLEALAEMEERHGSSVEAARAYQTAVRFAPANEDYRLALAVEYLRHQTFPPAIQLLEEGTRLFPASPRMRTALGLAYFLVDRNADAVKTLLTADSYPPALQYLGDIELEQSAEPDPAAVEKLCADPKFDSLCGGVLLRQAVASGDNSKQSKIFALLQQASARHPADPVARCQLGKAYEWAEQWTAARTELEACEQLQPDVAEYHFRLSRVYRKLGETKLANKEAALRSEAEAKEGAAIERRYATLTKFLYTQTK